MSADYTVTRIFQDENSTIGVISAPKLAMPLAVLELPWRDNKPNVSRIPPGTFGYSKWVSPSFGYETIRLNDDEVMPRFGVLFHRANYHRQLEGCFAPGLDWRNWKGEGWGVKFSEKGLDALLAAVPDTGTVHIVDAT